MNKFISEKFNNFTSSPYLSVTLVIITILFLLILTRMKVVEQQYKINEANRTIKLDMEHNRALKAQKAKKISIKNLKKFAKESQLKEPKEKQIIIIKE